MLVLGVDAGKHVGLALLERADGRMRVLDAITCDVRDPWCIDWCDGVVPREWSHDAVCVEVPKGTYPGKRSSSSLTRALVEASVVGMMLATRLGARYITTAAEVRRMYCASPTAGDQEVKRALARMGLVMPRGADNSHTRDAALAAVFCMRQQQRGKA
jgi:hypothetical protein